MAKQHSEKEIKQMAEGMVDSWWKHSEKKCKKCNTENCVHNDSCVNCKSTF
jgi:hypothetical protein